MFVGCMFLEIGIGLLFGELGIGTLIGRGVGIISQQLYSK